MYICNIHVYMYEDLTKEAPSLFSRYALAPPNLLNSAYIVCVCLCVCARVCVNMLECVCVLVNFSLPATSSVCFCICDKHSFILQHIHTVYTYIHTYAHSYIHPNMHCMHTYTL